MVVFFGVPPEAQPVNMRVPHPPGRGRSEREHNTDVYMSPKRFQEEIYKKIVLHNGEISGGRERDPPPTADPYTERSPESVRLTQSAPYHTQTNRLLLNCCSARRNNEVLAIMQPRAKNSHSSHKELQLRPIYFNLPAEEEPTSLCEFPIPILDANKRNTDYVMRKSEPIYAFQRKYRNKVSRNDSNKSSDSEAHSEDKQTPVKRNVALSQCEALGLNSSELSRLDRPSRGDVNLLPRPVERFPYKPLRSSSFVVARRKRNADDNSGLRRSISQHNMCLSTKDSTSDLNVKSYEMMGKEAMADTSLNKSFVKVRSSLKSSNSILATPKPEYETPGPYNSCKTSEANFDQASRAARSAKGTMSSAFGDIPLNDIEDVSDDRLTYAPRPEHNAGQLHLKTQFDIATKSGRSGKGNVWEISGKSTIISTSEGLDQCTVVQRSTKPKSILIQPRFYSPNKNSKEVAVKNIKARNTTPSQSAGLAHGFRTKQQGSATISNPDFNDGSTTLFFRPKRQPAADITEIKSRNSMKPSTSIVFKSRYMNRSSSHNLEDDSLVEKVPKLELASLNDAVDQSESHKALKYSAQASLGDSDCFTDLLLASKPKAKGYYETVKKSDSFDPEDHFHDVQAAEQIMVRADQYMNYQHSKFNKRLTDSDAKQIQV